MPGLKAIDKMTIACWTRHINEKAKYVHGEFYFEGRNAKVISDQPLKDQILLLKNNIEEQRTKFDMFYKKYACRVVDQNDTNYLFESIRYPFVSFIIYEKRFESEIISVKVFKSQIEKFKLDKHLHGNIENDINELIQLLNNEISIHRAIVLRITEMQNNNLVLPTDKEYRGKDKSKDAHDDFPEMPEFEDDSDVSDAEESDNDAQLIQSPSPRRSPIPPSRRSPSQSPRISPSPRLHKKQRTEEIFVSLNCTGTYNSSINVDKTYIVKNDVLKEVNCRIPFVYCFFSKQYKNYSEIIYNADESKDYWIGDENNYIRLIDFNLNEEKSLYTWNGIQMIEKTGNYCFTSSMCSIHDYIIDNRRLDLKILPRKY